MVKFPGFCQLKLQMDRQHISKTYYTMNKKQKKISPASRTYGPIHQNHDHKEQLCIYWHGKSVVMFPNIESQTQHQSKIAPTAFRQIPGEELERYS